MQSKKTQGEKSIHQNKGKKIYQKPDIRSEMMFEKTVLKCTKVIPGPHCGNNGNKS